MKETPAVIILYIDDPGDKVPGETSEIRTIRWLQLHRTWKNVLSLFDASFWQKSIRPVGIFLLFSVSGVCVIRSYV